MVRNRLRSFAWLTTTGLFFAGTATLVACSGKVNNGSVTSRAQPVALSAISSTPPTPCNAGQAHPNVCCESGPGQPASCVAYPSAPFTQCAAGATTYPDPRSCCSLEGNGACASPPPAPVDAGPGPAGSCTYECPVGWYSPPSSSGAGSSGTGGGNDTTTCCETGPDGTGVCTGGGSTVGSSSGAGSSGGSSGGSCTCACFACDPDSGVCPPCPPCNCAAPPPTTTSCDTCPPGWQTPAGEPLLCCEGAPDGTINCFSQGVPPSPPQDQDGGSAPVPASCFGGGGGSADGGPTFTQCGCSETVSGVDYTVTCTDPGGTCVCSTGSSGTGPTVPEPATSCGDLAALFGACGFPASVSGGSAGGSPGIGGGSAGSSGSSSGG